MKQRLLFATFILLFIINHTGLSQTYKIDEQRIYSWDNTAMTPGWKHDITEQMTFGNDGNKETLLVGLSIPSMENVYRKIKTYNANNDIILEVNEFWNSVSMQWEISYQITYVYDGANKLTSITQQSYSTVSMTYTNSIRELFTYTGTDIETQTSQAWNGVTWVNDEKSDYTYISPGNPDTAIYRDWNLAMMTWDITDRDTATYSMGMISEILGEDYNGSSYDNSDKTTFTYDGSLLKVTLTETWNGSSWDNEDQELFSYDSDDNNDEIIFESWVSSAWEPYYRAVRDFYVAAPFSLGSESFIANKFKVFPNPTSDVVNISSSIPFDKIEMYNVLGKKILESTNNKQINVETLNAGIYLLKIFNNDRSATKKIVIK